MEDFFRLVGPQSSLEVFGIRLVGVNAENGKKLLFTIAFVLLTIALAKLLRRVTRYALRKRASPRAEFWTRQGISLFSALLMIVGIASIWFDDPTRLATAIGLITAGLAFALQKVVTALAGYFVILRGKMFNVGDRITMGGVRGDVIALDFTRTTLMEMGQPPPVQASEPAMWVKSRQYTGRIVTVTNAKVFDEPVYNYTRDFPYIWEEMTVPITYKADRATAELIVLEAAKKHTIPLSSLGEEALLEMKRRYFMKDPELFPRVYFRLTDNWLELTVRFLADTHGIRELKDAISREIIAAFDRADIGIASSTVEVIGLPPLPLGKSEATANPASAHKTQCAKVPPEMQP